MLQKERPECTTPVCDTDDPLFKRVLKATLMVKLAGGDELLRKEIFEKAKIFAVGGEVDPLKIAAINSTQGLAVCGTVVFKSIP